MKHARPPGIYVRLSCATAAGTRGVLGGVALALPSWLLGPTRQAPGTEAPPSPGAAPHVRPGRRWWPSALGVPLGTY